MKQLINASREYCLKMLEDPYRPTYHFTIPEDNGVPFDPNGAFFADGRYHLMYIYQHSVTAAYHWGHISSTDLLHWRRHPDVLKGGEGDKGYFSGGAFVDDDGSAYITFWKFPSELYKTTVGGVGLAVSKPPYDIWEPMTPIAVDSTEWGIIDMDIDGEIKHISCADPSNIWKSGDTYYMQLGNFLVLHKYGYEPDSPAEYKGDYTDLFKSKDLKSWSFAGRFYSNPHLDDDFPDDSEDDMCPSFLPLPDKKSEGTLTDKWLQIFISHNKGSQYYIGDLKGEKFYPTSHGRFTWKDNTLFAPEALIDNKNRHIAWFWLHDNPKDDFKRFGWSGVYNFPRVLWLEDGMLRMAPAEELEQLQYNKQTFDVGVVEESEPILVKNGEAFRINADIKLSGATKAGFSVRISRDGNEHTDIYVDTARGKLIFDATESGCDGWMICEEAPFELGEGELLHLDIFVDKSVVEVYANERQAIGRRVYPRVPSEAIGVAAISDGADFGTVCAWEMSPTNPY